MPIEATGEDSDSDSDTDIQHLAIKMSQAFLNSEKFKNMD
jgi:hypothetical protein